MFHGSLTALITPMQEDGSLDLARNLAASRPRMRIFSQADRGVFDAMNEGVRLARGRYLYFLGAGDELLPGSLGEVARWLPEHNHALLYGNVLLADGRIFDGKFPKAKLARYCICHQAIFYGREIFDVIGGYNLKYKSWSDWEFNIRCFGSRDITVSHMPLMVAKFEEAGISGNPDVDFKRDKLGIICRRLGLRYCFWYPIRPYVLDYWDWTVRRWRRLCRIIRKLPGVFSSKCTL